MIAQLVTGPQSSLTETAAPGDPAMHLEDIAGSWRALSATRNDNSSAYRKLSLSTQTRSVSSARSALRGAGLSADAGGGLVEGLVISFDVPHT